MAGRKSAYTPKIGEEICARIANGESLRAICKSPGMPDRVTVLRWALKEDHPFRNQYTQARDLQADSLADDIQDISDDGSNDWMERANKRGEIEIVVDHENINRSRLRVDTRKWIASKLKPKKYGEKIQNEHSFKSLEDLLDESRKSPVDKKE